MKPRLPARVEGYVALVTVLAAFTAWIVSESSPAWREPSWGVTAVVALLIATTDRLAIRFAHRGSIENLCAIEGLSAPFIFCASGARTLLAVGVGVALAQIVNRNHPVKGLFNVAQWMLCVSAGIALWHALALPHDGSAESLLGLALALVVVVLVNQGLMSGVLWCATGHVLGTDDAAGGRILMGRLIGAGFNGVLGVVGTALYVWQPWVVVLIVLPLLMLHGAGRSEAAMFTNQRRLLALQRAGRHLNSALDRTGVQAFLDEIRENFDVDEIQLVLFNDSDAAPTCFAATASDAAPRSALAIADEVCRGDLEPLHVSSKDRGELATLLRLMEHSDGLLVPLTSGARQVGVLMLFDRLGVEGFEKGELTVASALARELVGFLDRVALVSTIEDERRKLADIVDHTGDGIVSLDREGTLLSWNAGMAEMTGYTAAEMVGTRHLGLLRARDVHGNDLYPENWFSKISTSQLVTEMQIVTAAGNTVWLACSFSVVPGPDGQPNTLVGVARNITQARELELLKDDFVAVVSHELRTPLVPIKGWAQTLLARGDRLTDDQRRTAVQSILSQAQRLESLVLNILESSRVEAGHVEDLDVVDVSAVAVRVAEDVLAARPDRVIRVRPPAVPCHVRGSAVWVERAISNLVANAVKYSPDDEPVDVLVTAVNGRVSVSVTDRGPGIPEDAQDRIFARFERLEESRKQTGTGLGLYITRRLARGMGGDVTVSSLPGAGSTFVLWLPAVVAAATSSLQLPEPRSDVTTDAIPHSLPPR